jgi:N-acetyl-anhydromuramyl-L-alanine amidase AmpD
VHFCIDNDGTIYQLADLQHACWHASDRTVNHKSIGVEISNAYYTKYQDWYTKRFGPRPVVTDAVVHGRTLDPHLGFYPVQIEALKALWEAVSNACGIPLEAPLKNGELDTGENRDVSSGKFEGFVNHYNVTNRKIDCAGLDLVKLLNEVKAD